MAVEGLRAATESEPEVDDARRGATRSAAAAGATPPRSARATKPRGSLRRRVETRGARVGIGAAREQVVGGGGGGGGLPTDAQGLPAGRETGAAASPRPRSRWGTGPDQREGPRTAVERRGPREALDVGQHLVDVRRQLAALGRRRRGRKGDVGTGQSEVNTNLNVRDAPAPACRGAAGKLRGWLCLVPSVSVKLETA